VLVALMHIPEASAWSFALQSASRRVFMYVGTATYTYGQDNKATGVINNPTVDEMRVQLILSSIGSGRSQVFNTVPTNRTYASEWNRSGACPTGYSIIVGAGYQNSSNTPANATVAISSPAQMTSMEGYGIPFSSVYWASFSPDTQRKDGQWIESGNLGTTQTLATVPRNSVSEVCFYFGYRNAVPYSAGTYEGIVTFTASTP
jgi:hypothetical protein